MKVAHKARDIFASQKLLIGFLSSATSFFLGGTKKGGLGNGGEIHGW